MRNVFALAAAAALISVPASAGVQDFRVVNSTGYDIHYVYVSPVDSNSWEEDVLGSDVLANGNAVNIRFDSAEDQCYWDIKVIYEDGDDAFWEDIDLCSVSVVELEYDADTGDTWATTS